MPQKDIAVQKRIERIIPGEIQRHQMRDQIVVLGDAGPRLRRHFARRLVAQEMDVHDFSPERGRACRAFDGERVTHVFELVDDFAWIVFCCVFWGCTLRTTLPVFSYPRQRLIDKPPDLVRGRIATDEIQQPERVRLVRGAHQLEEIVQQVSVVGQLVGCALCGHAPALVERFVKDADAVEGAAVVAGGGAGALAYISVVLWMPRVRVKWTGQDSKSPGLGSGGRAQDGHGRLRAMRDQPSASTSYTPNTPSKPSSSTRWHRCLYLHSLWVQQSQPRLRIQSQSQSRSRSHWYS